MAQPVRTAHPAAWLVAAALLAVAAPASADVTAFLGVSPTPGNRAARGVAGGVGLVVLGFEFEYSHVSEDEVEQLPSLKTWSGNVLLTTPVEVGGTRFYATAGVGAYRETLDTRQETHAAINLGGGVKIRLAGPLRVRLDYRVFTLRGAPLNGTYQRFYAGANLAF